MTYRFSIVSRTFAYWELPGSLCFYGQYKKEVQLINDVVIEGIVVREPWKFMEDLFFRMAVFRDTDLPAKPLNADRDAVDYNDMRILRWINGIPRWYPR